MIWRCKQWWAERYSLGQEEVEHAAHQHEDHCPGGDEGVWKLLDSLHTIERFVSIFVKLSLVSVFPKRLVTKYSVGRSKIHLLK